MKNKYGEEYKGDSKFVAKCRKLQSIYRVEIGEEIRPYTDRYGNNKKRVKVFNQWIA